MIGTVRIQEVNARQSEDKDIDDLDSDTENRFHGEINHWNSPEEVEREIWLDSFTESLDDETINTFWLAFLSLLSALTAIWGFRARKRENKAKKDLVERASLLVELVSHISIISTTSWSLEYLCYLLECGKLASLI